MPLARAKNTAAAVSAMASARSTVRPEPISSSTGASFITPVAMRPTPAEATKVRKIR